VTSFLKGFFSGTMTKFLTAVLGAGAASMATGHFNWKVLATGLVAALGVYLFPNSTPPAA
jgi:hypothetical protein